jgi:hypothetical protein
MLDTIDDTTIRAALVRYVASGGIDRDAAHELYHEDAILEFPQSGERFIGRDTFREWRERYPSETEFRIRRILGHGAFWSVELLVSYDGRPPMFGLGLYEFRGAKVAREVVYVMDGWDAPGWRAAWNAPFDRLASAAPSEIREGEPFGLEAQREASLSRAATRRTSQSVRL